MNAQTVIAELKALGSPEKARVLQSFFKTGPGEYGEGDVFIGVTVPATRRLALAHRDLPPAGIARLLASPVHEVRLLALLILVEQYHRGGARERAAVVRTYLANLRRVNNWDLVDLTAPNILGQHLVGRNRAALDRLAASPNLWRRRVAIVATYAFIRRGEHGDTLRLAARLLVDPEDLIHKAAGWMLREVGKRDSAALERFLGLHAPRMPRTMLRYAIERFPEPLRRRYLSQRRQR